MNISDLLSGLDVPHDGLVRLGGDLAGVAEALELHLGLDHPQLRDDGVQEVGVRLEGRHAVEGRGPRGLLRVAVCAI